jgi:hypothetical protein
MVLSISTMSIFGMPIMGAAAITILIAKVPTIPEITALNISIISSLLFFRMIKIIELYLSDNWVGRNLTSHLVP